jgi:hypothetical protein
LSSLHGFRVAAACERVSFLCVSSSLLYWFVIHPLLVCWSVLSLYCISRWISL